MNAILKRLNQLGEDDLLSLSEAIDAELERRQSRFDEIPDSARRRALAREHSYRRCNGASAPPIRAIGLHEIRRNRAA